MNWSCLSKLRHMRHASRWRLRARSSFASSGRSQARDSRLEALRQLTSSSAAMRRALAEPVVLEAAAKGDARAVQDHPAVGSSDAFVAADGGGVVAEDLAPEEDAA